MQDVQNTWNVLIDRYPLPPGEKVGEVHAMTREEAMDKARDHYGAGHVVLRRTANEVNQQREQEER